MKNRSKSRNDVRSRDSYLYGTQQIGAVNIISKKFVKISSMYIDANVVIVRS